MASARHPARAALLAAWRRLCAVRLEGRLAAFVVFAGQSNALGFGMDASTLPADYARPDPLTLIWSEPRQAFEPLRPGENTGTENTPGAWGPEAAFARAFRQANPKERLYIVKSAKGSTGLAADPGRLDWSPSSPGELFDATTARVEAARAAAGSPRVDAVFIVQGEQDAAEAASAEAYLGNMAGWFAAIRGRWMADADGRIFFARLAEPLAHMPTVSAAQGLADAADPHARAVDTGDFPLQADRLHFTAAAHVRMGEAFGQMFEEGREDDGAVIRLARRARALLPGGR